MAEVSLAICCWDTVIARPEGFSLGSSQTVVHHQLLWCSADSRRMESCNLLLLIFTFTLVFSLCLYLFVISSRIWALCFCTRHFPALHSISVNSGCLNWYLCPGCLTVWLLMKIVQRKVHRVKETDTETCHLPRIYSWQHFLLLNHLHC